MLYLAVAVLAHVGNAFVFIFDKTLLTSGGAISNPLRMTYYTGLLSVAAIVMTPWVDTLPGSWLLLWSVVAAMFFFGALWCFFTALKTAEPTRVVPITGSAVPVFTMLFALVFLGEQLAVAQGIGVVLLIIGGGLLSISMSGVRGLTLRTITLAVTAACLFAGNFAVMKYIYEGSASFAAAFMYSRVMMTITAVLFLGPLLFILRRPQSRPRRRPKLKDSHRAKITGLFIGNKALGASTVVLQNYAISLGSVTIVNSLQGVQYAVLLVLATMVSRWWPRLWREELQPIVVWQKIAGIACISAGLFFILL